MQKLSFCRGDNAVPEQMLAFLDPGSEGFQAAPQEGEVQKRSISIEHTPRYSRKKSSRVAYLRM